MPQANPARRAAAGRLRRASTLVATVGATAILVVSAATPTDASASRVTICHQVGNLSYRVITVDVNSIRGGHGHHQGDIIPAFSARQGNRETHYAGRNLNTVLRAADGLTGADVLAAGCAVPAPAATAQVAPPTSGAVATPTPVTTLAPDTTVQAVPTPTETAVPGTADQTTLAPDTTSAPPIPTSQPTAVPVPTSGPPSPTLAPTATPSPTPTTAPEPTLAPSRTVAPDITSTPATPTATPAPVPTLAPTPTLAPSVTGEVQCPDGELAHDGNCFAVPPLVIPPRPELATVTSQPPNGTLTPIVECVDTRPDGVRVVWFNYESTVDSSLTVERGPANQVNPRGVPPTLFGPGLHIYVMAVETTDGVASWTLAGRTATSGADTGDCATALTTAPTGPETTGTTQPATTGPDTTGTTQPAGTESSPAGTGGPGRPGTGSCEPGETEADGDCVAVQPLRLVLVDNVLECDGHGVARFAAFNENTFALDADNATSLISPQRLASETPEVIDEADVVSDDGTETAALFTVRYVTAVTWTVQHHGLEASVSAGANAATTDPSCPQAATAVTGSHGVLSSGGSMPITGPEDALPMSIVAGLLSALGIALVVVARRRPPAVG